MLPEQRTEVTWPCRLRTEGVGQAHRIVVTVPEACGDLTNVRTILIEQGGVRVAEHVPTHPTPLQRTESLIEGAARLAVGETDRQVKRLQDLLTALIKRDEAFAGACLRAVHGTTSVTSPLYSENGAFHIPLGERESLPDTQAGEEAQLGEQPPLFRHALDHPDEVGDGDVVAAPRRRGEPAARRWKW